MGSRAYGAQITRICSAWATAKRYLGEHIGGYCAAHIGLVATVGDGSRSAAGARRNRHGEHRRLAEVQREAEAEEEEGRRPIPGAMEA